MEMMKVRNPNLAGKELTLRFTRDEDDNRLVVKGDATGVFAVPEKDAKFLLKTKGWKAYTKPARGLEEAVADNQSDDSNEVPDLDALTKAQLLDVAQEYVDQGYDIEVDNSMVKGDIKQAIADAIFEE